MKKLTFTNLGNYGRLGNQLFEVASLIGIANKLGYKPCIPTDWKYRDDFNIPEEYYEDVAADNLVRETQFHYDPKFVDKVAATDGEILDICGTFQSRQYWIDIEDKIKEWLTPKNMPPWRGFIGVHIRRGDYVSNPSYCQYDIEWYRQAMSLDCFSGLFWVCSDDMESVKKELGDGEGFTFSDKTRDIEDLASLIACRSHILSGSSFSWWAAYLSKAGGKVVRVPRTHTGKLANLDESTMWLPEWEVFDPEKKKVRLVTYADDKYKEGQALINQMNIYLKEFDEVVNWDRSYLETFTEFYKKNKKLLDQKRGAGYWAWKPYVILEELKKMREGEYLMYLDSGDIFFSGIRKHIIESLDKHPILLLDGGNQNSFWTKQYCFDSMRCNFNEFYSAKQIEAGVIIVRNCGLSRSIIERWMEYCTDEKIINDDLGNERPEFIEHRHDQSILTNLMVLYNIPVTDKTRKYVNCNVELKEYPKTDLKDVTFIIPVGYDHNDRIENLALVLKYLSKYFDTNIIVGENAGSYFKELAESEGCKYVQFDYDCFHRTRMLNEMTRMAGTEMILNYDADILLVPEAVVEATEMMRNGVEFTLPYNGAFIRVPRTYYKELLATLNVSILKGMVFKGHDDMSVGGCVGFRRSDYKRYGLENQEFVSHGAEDVERIYRVSTIGNGYKRVDYPLYHIDHFIGKDSSHNGHEYSISNRSEFRRVKNMNKEELERYVALWPWNKW